MAIPEERYVGDFTRGSGEVRDLKRQLDAHIGKGGNAHAIATHEEAGFMSQSDKEKLDTVQNGATQNQTDDYLLNLANATGELPIDQVEGLQEEIDRISGDSAAQLREDLADDVAGDLGAHLIAYPSPEGEDWNVADLANPDKGAAMVGSSVVVCGDVGDVSRLPVGRSNVALMGDSHYIFVESDLSWQVSSDPARLNFIAPEGEDGSGGAWVYIPADANSSSSLSQREMSVYSDVRASEDYPNMSAAYFESSGLSSRYLLVSAYNKTNACGYVFREDIDGFVRLYGAVVGGKDFVGTRLNGEDRTGSFSTPGSNPNWYATSVGATITIPFTGTGVVFYHYADSRGGVWSAAIDGVNVLEFSTYSQSVENENAVVIAENLADSAHTLVLTFMGADPENPPIGGSARGWFKFGVAGYEGIYSTVQTTDLPTATMRLPNFVINRSSVQEFAIRMSPDGWALGTEWVPNHTSTAGSTRAISRDISINGVRFGSALSGIPAGEISGVFKIRQRYTAYNSNDDAGDFPLWDGVITCTIERGELSVSHKIQFRSSGRMTVGYSTMLPSTNTVVDKFETGRGYLREVTVPPTTVDYDLNPSLSAAFMGKGKAVAIEVREPQSVLPGDLRTRPLSFFYQERADTICKAYFSRWVDGDRVEEGEMFSINYKIFMSNNY